MHEAARRLGKDTGYLENRLFLLKAPDDVREMVSARADSVCHAREIAKVESPKARQKLIEAAVAGAPFAAIQERVRSTLEAAVRQLALGLPFNKRARAKLAAALEIQIVELQQSIAQLKEGK